MRKVSFSQGKQKSSGRKRCKQPLYQKREEEYRKIAGYIQKTVRHREGNYMVFFPSYQLMEEVYEIYQQMAEEEGVRCLLQEPGMKEAQREAFLENFQNSRGTLVGFCVMGESFRRGLILQGAVNRRRYCRHRAAPNQQGKRDSETIL